MSTIVPAVETVDIEKRYGGVQALNGVSLQVLPGQIVALLGENGAGKSTLMRIISGLERADAGELRIAGHLTQLVNAMDAHRHGIRLVPQELTLCPELSVAENIELGSMVSRRGVLDRRAVRDSARRKLAQLDVALDVTALVRDLPLAEQAFVQIARALVPGTHLMILDEPTAALSGDEAERVLRAVEAVAASGVGVIYISHRLDEVYEFADKIVVLRDGRVAREFDARGVDRDAVVSAMVGSRQMHEDRASAASDRVVLRVEGLAGTRLLDFTADVHAGEIVAVYGVLGSGREEVAGCVVGAHPRARGGVSVNGRAVRLAGGMRAARACGMGYVPAERRSQGLVLDKTVEFNATLAVLPQLTRRLVFDKPAALRITNQYCDELGIKGDAQTEVDKLSGGNQQKVLVARWLAAGVEALILDEPTRGVDVGAKAEMYDTIRRQAEKGTAILICSSDLEEVCTIADRAIVLGDGHVVAEFPRPTELEVAAAAARSYERGESA